MSVGAPAPGRGRVLWVTLIAAAAVLIVARNLSGLASAPLGAYIDETSIGYNAWAISTHAVDEHGAHLPLYFTAFGDFKNPVYVYTLSALLRVLPLTVTTERLPAALFGLITCLFITLIAWRRSRSRPITLLTLALVGLTPWLTVESRVGFEVIAMIAAVSGALWCLSIAQDDGRPGWYLAAGCLLAVAVFAYSTGRLAVALMAMALVIAEGWRRGRKLGRWLVALVPVGCAYALLEAWNLQHPGALVARFDVISIGADGAPPATVAGRFVGNYLTYFGPDFLFVNGDQRTRHATHFGGMLLWVTLPLVVAGIVAAWRLRRQRFMRFVLLGTLAAPVSAALTEESVPHALRAAVMLPFLLVLAVEGMVLVAQSRWFGPSARSAARTPPWARASAALVALALVVQGALFTVDLYAAWPARSALDFDAGEIDAITRAHALAGGAQVLLSSTLEAPYIQAAFALRPSPPQRYTVDSMTPLLDEMHMALIDPNVAPAQPGAIAVLSAVDPVPPRAQRLFEEITPRAQLALGTPPPQFITVVVYRLH
jgi:4-amino-4-deoxy-L-arabinose transferase-like glycosyltransferase